MNEDQHHHKLDISPLFVGLLGIMAGATIVAIFHCIVIGWCRCNQRPNRGPVAPPVARRIIRTNNINNNNNRESTRSIVTSTSSSTSTSTSTESSVVHLIPAYRFSGEFKQGTCAVCLSEFNEGEDIRVLPECAHLFHISCIDMWLYSHSNCPLCRAEMVVPPHLHRPPPIPLLPPPPPQLHVTVMLQDSSMM